MHRCWDVPELKLAIFKNLDDYDAMRDASVFGASDREWNFPPPRKMRALAHLATTCREFSDCALDLMWAVQHDYRHLLSCLPTDTWMMDDRGQFHIHASLRPEDWDRVLFHSHRIKEMYDTKSGCVKVHPSVLDALLASLPPGPLLPNIRALSCRSVTPLFPHLATLVGRKLIEVQVELSDEKPWCLSAIQKIAATSPVLQRVLIAGRSPQYMEWSMRFISTLDQLRSLSLDAIDATLFDHISTLERLESLSLHKLGSQILSSSMTSLPHHPRFPALRTLHIATASLECVPIFLPAVNCSPLRMFTVVCRAGVTSLRNEASNAIAAIGAYCSPSHLTFIKIKLGPEDRLGPMEAGASPLPGDALRPLLRLSCLRHVELVYPGAFLPDDSFIQYAAISWSALEEFSIQCQSGWQPQTTLSSVLSLAQHCPRLRSLVLDVNATDI
ncbi:hypothetical protein R3P38DRAFT_2709994, partial [Favolaschia claudopus]